MACNSQKKRFWQNCAFFIYRPFDRPIKPLNGLLVVTFDWNQLSVIIRCTLRIPHYSNNIFFDANCLLSIHLHCETSHESYVDLAFNPILCRKFKYDIIWCQQSNVWICWKLSHEIIDVSYLNTQKKRKIIHRNCKVSKANRKFICTKLKMLDGKRKMENIMNVFITKLYSSYLMWV